MPTNSVQDGIETDGAIARQRVSISLWVNEPYPAWDRILTAHDVARLIRRPPWMLKGLAAIGQFPEVQRFHGKHIGWLKADILRMDGPWLPASQVVKLANSPHGARRRHLSPNQHVLPLQVHTPALRPQIYVLLSPEFPHDRLFDNGCIRQNSALAPGL